MFFNILISVYLVMQTAEDNCSPELVIVVLMSLIISIIDSRNDYPVVLMYDISINQLLFSTDTQIRA